LAVDPGVDERFEGLLEAARDFRNDLLSLAPLELLRKVLFYYEELRSLRDVPGDLVEFGVYRGTTLCFLDDANRIIDGPNSSRSIVGFDTFSGFPEEPGGVAWQRDNETRELFRDTSLEILRRKLQFRPQSRIRLVAGDIRETLPRHASAWPNRIAMAICDADVADVTRAILDGIWDRMSPGGRIYFDEYSRDGWSETVGVDEFLRDRGLPPDLVRRSQGVPFAFVQR
jgi:Macrocin-O-methyltransferase (TylF)